MDTTARLNGTAHAHGKAPARPAKARSAPKPGKGPPADGKAPARPQRGAELAGWALAGVGVMSALSALLNGYDHASHAPSPLAGWLMGVSVPLIILILGKVAGAAHKRGLAALAYVTAGAGVGLLALSVWHCSCSIAALTGSPVALAVPMAVAIDVGMIACECAVVVA
jgi:hypothetical protein